MRPNTDTEIKTNHSGLSKKNYMKLLVRYLICSIFSYKIPLDVKKTGCPWKLYSILISMIPFALLSGCSPLQKDFHAKNYFSLQIETKDFQSKTLEPHALLVRQLSISPEFETSFFVYGLGSGQYQKDYYNQFLVPPARMITNILAENLYSSGLFSSVLENEPFNIYYRLSGKIVNLYVDIKDPDRPSCILSIRLILDKKIFKEGSNHLGGSSGFIPLMTEYYEVSIPLSDNAPEAMALAWSQGLQRIFYKFYKDIQNFI